MRTIVSVASARPNFVKLAAVHHALADHPDAFRHLIVHTGQHYDPLLSDIFFQQLRIPDPILNLGIAGGDRLDVIKRTGDAFASHLSELAPELVLVYGDVNGAVGAARATHAANIKLGHVEAGLRSYDNAMPEEVNRIEIDRLADLLFCSEKSGMDHLTVEEETQGQKFLVGNTMIDTLIRMKSDIRQAEIPEDLPDEYAVATLHRPSNVDDEKMLMLNVDTLLSIASSIPVLLPMHPRLKNALEVHGLYDRLAASVRLLSPLGYLSFLRLLSGSSFVLTDSGGIQEEAVLLGKRCFTLRKNTERPSTIESGSNVLIDLGNENDRTAIIEFAKNPMNPTIIVPDFWDGKAGERIVKILQESL